MKRKDAKGKGSSTNANRDPGTGKLIKLPKKQAVYPVPDQSDTANISESDLQILQAFTRKGERRKANLIPVGPGQKPESRMTPIEKMEISDQGITKKELERFKEKSALNYDQLAKVLSVTKATLINKKGNSKFRPGLSEKILGLADIYSFGFAVFEDKNRFNEWIFRPNKALGGKAPFDILHNSFGREEVRNLIGRIDFGVYS